MGREKRGSEAHFSPLPIVPRAIYFSIIVIFIGIPSGSLCAVERKYAGFWNISLENVRRAVSPDMTKYPCRVSEVDLDPSRSENEHLLVVHLIAKSWFNFGSMTTAIVKRARTLEFFLRNKNSFNFSVRFRLSSLLLANKLCSFFFQTSSRALQRMNVFFLHKKWIYQKFSRSKLDSLTFSQGENREIKDVNSSQIRFETKVTHQCNHIGKYADLPASSRLTDKGVITWDRNELRPVRICNFCSRLHETGTKRFVDYMGPVQTQKQEILGAI